MSKLLDVLSEYLARRKGLLPLTGIVFIFANLVLQFVPVPLWLSGSNLLLHIGIVIAIVGLMLAWAL